MPPPGAGVETDSCATSKVARSIFGMIAVNELELLYVVERDDPFHWTTEVGEKLEPYTVTVRSLLPMGAAVGEIEFSVGAGGALTVSVAEFETPPDGGGV